MLEYLKPGHFFIAPDDADFEYLSLGFDMASGDFVKLLAQNKWTVALYISQPEQHYKNSVSRTKYEHFRLPYHSNLPST